MSRFEIEFLPFGDRRLILQELTGNHNNHLPTESFGPYLGKVTLNFFQIW